ncbi:PEGA domain-containing protein [Myxococcota bacterium]|nr:PEGA domain-containing protein [Myxococcota bacterium]
MSKRSGLFGHRPDLLLVDERPPSIDLAAVAPTRLPRLLDEPAEPPPAVADDEPPEDEDYDGGGPLRIFIGSPKGEGARAAAPPISGPVWDASALAAGADDEFDTDVDLEPVAPRAPVLVRPPGSAPQPPPLTMSFGGSFSRGSLDAGVMDEDSASVSSSDVRADTVVVHDQIFDRFLRFEDPLDTPPVRGPEPAVDDEPEEPLSVGAFDEEEVLEAMDSELHGDLVTGPPPTRGLTVGFVRGPALDEGEDDDGSDILDDEPGARDEDEDEDEDAPAAPRVVIGDQAPPTRLGQAGGSAPRPTPVASAPPAVPVPPSLPPPRLEPPTPAPQEDTELDLGAPVEEPAPSRLAPDWSERRPDPARRGVSLPDPGGPPPEEDSGRLGLIAFALVAVIAVLVTWLLLRLGERPPAEPVPMDGASLEEAPVPVTPAAEAPAAQDGGGAAVEGGAATPEAPPVAAAEPTPEVAGTAAEPAVGADAPIPTGADVAGEDEGVLRIRATRTSRVYIDGAYVGQTPLPALALPAGSHDVRVVAIDSGRSRSQDVRVDAGRSQEVRFSF